MADMADQPQRLRFAIRSRRIGDGVYVRKDDLLRWFDQEAAVLREHGLDQAANQTLDLAASLRKVRAE